MGVPENSRNAHFKFLFVWWKVTSPHYFSSCTNILLVGRKILLNQDRNLQIARSYKMRADRNSKDNNVSIK